jgi:lipopolysaccharide transport system permease protein
MATAADEITVIEATRPGVLAAWRELWRFRSLYGYLFKQTASRRFQETILGPAWLLLRPLIPAVVMIIVFTHVVEIPSEGLPYAVFYFGGYLLWGLFASVVTFVPRAMRMNRRLMKKMYFPRILIPLASVGTPLAEFAVSCGVFLVIIGYFAARGELYLVGGPQLLVFPLLASMTLVLAICVGMIAGVFTLVARDVLYTLPHLLQLWMLLTPVLYSPDFVPERWRWLVYVLNPMAVLVQGAKWSLLGVGAVDYRFIGLAVICIVLISVAATLFFLRAEDVFMDDI